MSITGKIKTLFSDKENTEALFPRTKIKAVSADSGVGLDALLDEMNYNISNKAPAGFGLGEEYPRDITGNDANRASVSGLYWINTSTANTPTSAWLGIMAVKSRSSNEKTQIIDYFSDDKIYTVRRNIINGYGQPWEWVNPPMIPGVEYRTTERWNGKPVYTKLVNCGTAVSGATTVNTYTGNSYPIRCCSVIDNRYISPHIWSTPDNDHSIWVDTYKDSGYIHLAIFSGASNADTQVYAQIWYYKD